MWGFYMKTYRFYYPLKPLKIPSKNLPKIPQISSKPCPKYLQISSKNTAKIFKFPFFRSGAEIIHNMIMSNLVGWLMHGGAYYTGLQGSFKNMEACPDFDQILARFWSDFGQIFGQVFDEGFGQVFWSRKYSVQFYRDREIQFYRVRRKRREKPSLF